MAAVAFAHKAVRNVKLDYQAPEFELISQGYKRANSSVDQKQPVTTPILFKMRELLGAMAHQETLLWGSIILAFFFLDRCPELWGSVNIDKSTGADRVHCIQTHNVIVRDVDVLLQCGRQVLTTLVVTDADQRDLPGRSADAIIFSNKRTGVVGPQKLRVVAQSRVNWAFPLAWEIVACLQPHGVASELDTVLGGFLAGGGMAWTRS